MKKNFIVFLLLLLSLCANAQTEKEVITIDSKILKEQRTAWVYNPGKKNERLPVIYVLDGTSHFRSIVAMVVYLSGAGVIPPMIVVGILHSHRMKDLTPTIDDPIADPRGENTGGGEPFMSFIKNELMPKVESTYSTATYRVLVGHSVGGLTVINSLIHHKDFFNAYVSIDASLWWDKQRLLKESKAVLAANNYAGKRLFLAIANRMEKGVDTAVVQQDTTEHTQLIRSNLQFIKFIKSNQQNQLGFNYQYYPEDNHSSVSFIAQYDALRFIFNYYKFDVYESYLADDHIRLDSLLTIHFKNISKQLGYVVNPTEGLVNGLAYSSLNNKHLEKAEYLFKLNTANYPGSANAFDSLGDFYLATADKGKAIIYYQKALAMAEIPETRQKLNRLRNKK